MKNKIHNHTPGPWITGEAQGRPSAIFTEVNNVLIGHVDSTYDKASNAWLISKSPDMLGLLTLLFCEYSLSIDAELNDAIRAIVFPDGEQLEDNAPEDTGRDNWRIDGPASD